MSSPEFPCKIEVKPKDIAKAVWDVGSTIVGFLRSGLIHLPEKGYSSSHKSHEAHPDIFVTPVKDPYEDCLNEVQTHGFLYDERISR